MGDSVLKYGVINVNADEMVLDVVLFKSKKERTKYLETPDNFSEGWNGISFTVDAMPEELEDISYYGEGVLHEVGDYCGRSDG
jgi:hypothetical protein